MFIEVTTESSDQKSSESRKDYPRIRQGSSLISEEDGAALRPVLLALRDWGLEWIEGTAAKRA
jgi:DNA-binding HxlR family transcriptional regulator